MNSSEKRMAGSYEITHAMQIGDKEIVLGEDPNNAEGLMFMCAFCEQNGLFAQFSEIMGSDDYPEIVELFGRRIAEQAEKTRGHFLKTQQQGIDDAPITSQNCTVIGWDADLNGKIIVIEQDVLRPEYRRATCQLKLCTGGFGASPNSRGSAVYCTDLFTGKHSRFERMDVLGILEQNQLPQWAAAALQTIRQEKQKKQNREAR